MFFLTRRAGESTRQSCGSPRGPSSAPTARRKPGEPPSPRSPPPLQKYSRRPLCFLAHPDAHLLPAQQQNELFKSIRICHTFIENPRVFPLHCNKPCPHGPVTPGPQHSAPTPSSSAGRALPTNSICYTRPKVNLSLLLFSHPLSPDSNKPISGLGLLH